MSTTQTYTFATQHNGVQMSPTAGSLRGTLYAAKRAATAKFKNRPHAEMIEIHDQSGRKVAWRQVTDKAWYTPSAR